MRALKILVTVMGVMLVAGLAVVVATIVHRSTQRQAPAAASAAAGFGHITLNLPAGAHVVEMRDAGGRLVLRLQRADGGETLLILDPATGAEIGTIDLKPGP